MEIKYPIGGYAPGNYSKTCSECQESFVGDKRAVQCEPCAINLINKSHTQALSEVNKIKNYIQDIEFNSLNKTSKKINALSLTTKELVIEIELKRKNLLISKLQIVKWVWENSSYNLKESKQFVDNN